jgi:NADH-quinone oxidoreductase subunit H
MSAGPWAGQIIADGVKFAQKEPIVPRAADGWVFTLAPRVVLVPYIVTLRRDPPLAGDLRAEPRPSGIFFVLEMSSIGVIGTLMAGWASANKFSLMGAPRAAAQLIAYELPLVLVAAAIVMEAGTLSLVGIVEGQRDLWNVVYPRHLVGFSIFMVASLAELTRPPFDMPVADSEIIFGALTEYTA